MQQRQKADTATLSFTLLITFFFFFLAIKSSLNFPLFPFIHLVVLLEAGRTPTSQFVAMIIADVAVRVARANVEARRRYATLAVRVSTSGLRIVAAALNGRDLSQSSLPGRLHSLNLRNDHVGRISRCLADFWAAAFPDLGCR